MCYKTCFIYMYICWSYYIRLANLFTISRHKSVSWASLFHPVLSHFEFNSILKSLSTKYVSQILVSYFSYSFVRKNVTFDYILDNVLWKFQPDSCQWRSAYSWTSLKTFSYTKLKLYLFKIQSWTLFCLW